MKTIILSVFLMFASVANAGFWYKDLEFYALENFSVQKKDGNFYVGFDYVIKNPNCYAIVIKPSMLRLEVAGEDCGLVKIEEKIRLKRKTKASYPFVLKGDGSKFVKSAFSSIWSLMKGDGIDFTIKGKLKAGVALFKMRWKMDYTYSMSFEEFLSLF
ncbi:MAG: hypothetical protein ACPG21_09270 [Crocinitomicaceae bacterium]